MSSPPQETRTLDVDLSREQQWLVHYVLTASADEAIDDRTEPPAWLFDAVETIEAGEETFTVRQVRELLAAVETYSSGSETPAIDRERAATVTGRLEAALDTL